MIFKQTISSLRPGYYPPSKEDLAGPLLEKIYEEITETAASELQGENVTFVLNGCNDIHNALIIAHNVHIGENLYFSKSVALISKFGYEPVYWVTITDKIQIF